MLKKKGGEIVRLCLHVGLDVRVHTGRRVARSDFMRYGCTEGSFSNTSRPTRETVPSSIARTRASSSITATWGAEVTDGHLQTIQRTGCIHLNLCWC